MAEKKTVLAKKIVKILDDLRQKDTPVSLIFTNDKIRKSFFIKNSLIFGLDSSDVTEKFSALLVMSKQITKDDLKTLVTKEQSMWELDQKIIENKKLESEQIRKVFSLQLSRMVNSLLEWATITYKVSEKNGDWPSSTKKPLFLEEFYLHLFRHLAASDTDHTFWKDHRNERFVLNNDRAPKLMSMPLNNTESYVISACNNQLTPDQILGMKTIGEDALFEILDILRKLDFIVQKTDHNDSLAALNSSITENSTAETSTESFPEIAGPDMGDVDVRELIDKNMNLLSELETKDYFEIFEISPDNFSVTQVKLTYHDFVRQYHPDKFRRLNSDELNDIMENILNTLNTAYETLIDKERLAEYQKTVLTKSTSVSSTVSPSSSLLVAKENFLQGKSLINAQHYAEAIGYLKRAVRINPEDGDYHAYLGYAMSKTVQYRREAEEHFLKAIELTPMNINTYLHLGRLYREARMYLKAVKTFSEALKWDPENKIALKELQEIEKEQKSKSKGFLNKFFGK